MKHLMNFRSMLFGALLISGTAFAEPAEGWLSWRGPNQNGTSNETGLPDKWEPGAENQLWKYGLNGAGAPVIANGKLYAFGYGQEGDDTAEGVQEILLCLDANTGEKLWEKRYSDYISDVVYNRYGIGSPIVDAETGNIYLQMSNGRCVAVTPEGKDIWEISLMEELARLTFPNGRTGSAAIDGPLVIFHCVTANWGTTGPARDRFYAFDKLTGELVWYSTPGVRPVDSSFCMPVFGQLGDQRVFYAGTGCGNIVCVNARTGKPVWRFQLSQGGVNSQVVLYKDKLIALHGKENIDATSKGRLVCINIPQEYPAEQLVLDKSVEVWRNDDHIGFTSSPTLVEDRVYTTNFTGELICVDADSGKTLWQEKLAPDQIHASPAYGDGKIYAPWFEGSLAIVKPTDAKAEVLSNAEIKAADGSGVKALAAPTIWAGKIYLSTRDGLYCFGNKEGKYVGSKDDDKEAALGPVAQLQIVPAEFAIAPGQKQEFKVYGLDKSGRRVEIITEDLSWEKFIPPTAKVKAKVDATLDAKTGTITAGKDAALSAGALKVTHKGMSATTRGRVEATIGYTADFEDVELKMESPDGVKVNFPPLAWLGARIKWYVLEKDGSKVIANRLDNVLFQRTMNFFGGEDMTNYVIEANVMTDGNRRIKSEVGLINQRYKISLVGNKNVLEVSSNYERVQQAVKFPVKANQWYHLKTHVKNNGDGSGEVRAKAWTKGEDEPAEWTIKVPVKKLHPHGAPGIYAFSPQAQKRVYIDNIKISAGE